MRILEQNYNRLSVLKAIRRFGPVARTDLPARTGLSGGLITQLTAELLENGLIRERKDMQQRPGRPRVNLEINASGAVVIGASRNLDGTVGVSFIDLAGDLIFSCDVPLRHDRTLTGLAHAIALAIGEAITTSPFEQSGIRHVGLAMHAVVDRDHGVVLHITTLPPGPVPFAQIISRELGIAVTIENDVSCMARAEHWFGRARQMDSFTLINFDLALGSARYRDGLLITGVNGISAEIGHTKLYTGAEARPCYCGAKGCAGTYASIFGVLRAAGLGTFEGAPDTDAFLRSFDGLVEQAYAGDAAALSLLHQAGEMLGVITANHINASDPGNVLILLPNPQFADLITEHFDDALVANVMPGMLHNNHVTTAFADPDWRWKGTAALALEHTYLSTGRISKELAG